MQSAEARPERPITMIGEGVEGKGKRGCGERVWWVVWRAEGEKGAERRADKAAQPGAEGEGGGAAKIKAKGQLSAAFA